MANLTKKEIREFLENKDVIDYLKDNLKIDISIDPCEACLGYDIVAKAILHGNLITEETDYI